MLAVTVTASLSSVGWPALASAAAPAAKPAAASSTAAKPGAAPTVRTVTLITGDRITVTTVAGKSSYSFAAGAGHSGDYISYQGANGDHYVIPAEAQPYLNRQLSTSLFDVTALLRAGLTAGSQIPVSLNFAAGTTVAAPPGVTLTSSTGSTAQGYVTASSGTAFAAGLRADIGADVQAGRAAGTGPLFGGLAAMSLTTPGAVASAAISPHYPLYDLQLNTNDLTGAPADNVLVSLVNTDSLAKENTLTYSSGGVVRIAVPAGNYSAEANFTDFDAQGNEIATRMVVLTDFTVAAAGSTSVALDESTASNLVSFSTPRPAVQNIMTTYWYRTDSTGAVWGLSLMQIAPIPAYVNTQPAAKVGAMRVLQQWDAVGPATGDQYRYDVAYASSDIGSNQKYVITPGQLATVHQTFYADPAATQQGDTGIFMNGPGDAFDLDYGTSGTNTDTSGQVTEYLGTADGGGWWQGLITPGGLFYTADLHTFAAGHTYSIGWGHGPLAPNVGTHTGPQTTSICMDCASGGTLLLSLSSAGDSEPDHISTSFGGGPAQQFTLYQNGKKVGSFPGGAGDEVTGVSTTAPTTYRMVYTTDSTGNPAVSQSITTSTDLRFTYTPGLNPGNTLPSDVPCDAVLQTTAQCQILPVLNLDYHLATDQNNTSGVGPQLLGLTVNHLTYDGLGSHAAITSAKVSVSFDGGKTWTSAKVLGADGYYLAAWSNPATAAGTSPELRVSATDAAGGSITQTITAAYTIAQAGE